MRKPGLKIDLEQVARVLVDAHRLGDAAAAAKHNLSDRTLRNYRAKYGSLPEVAGVFRAAKNEIAVTWLEEAKKVELDLLARVHRLALASDNLRDVAGALKIVRDGVMAEKLLGLGGDKHGGQPDDSARMGGATRQGAPLHRAPERLGGPGAWAGPH